MLLIDLSYMLVGIWMSTIVMSCIDDIRKEFSYVPDFLLTSIVAFLAVITIIVWPVMLISGIFLYYSKRNKK